MEPGSVAPRMPRESWIGAGFVLACLLPFLALTVVYADPCEVGPDGDCWSAGMAAGMVMAMVPFAIFGIVVGSKVAWRGAKGRLPVNLGWSTALVVGAWLLFPPILLYVMALWAPQLFFNALLHSAAISLVPLLSFAGWWTCVVALTGFAFRRDGRPALSAPS